MVAGMVMLFCLILCLLMELLCCSCAISFEQSAIVIGLEFKLYDEFIRFEVVLRQDPNKEHLLIRHSCIITQVLAMS
jgi:hypothetical protein